MLRDAFYFCALLLLMAVLSMSVKSALPVADAVDEIDDSTAPLSARVEAAQMRARIHTLAASLDHKGLKSSHAGWPEPHAGGWQHP